MLDGINAFNYTSNISLSAGIFLGMPAIEMAVRTLVDLGDLFTVKFCSPIVESNKIDQIEEQKMRLKRRETKVLSDLRQDAAGALVCGFFAANLFTGASVIGALGFCIFAKMNCLTDDACYATKAVGLPIKILCLPEVRKGIKGVINFIFRRVIKGIKSVQKGLLSVIHTIKNIFSKIFKAVFLPFKYLALGISKIGKLCLAPFKVIGKVAGKVLHPLGKSLAGISKACAKSPKVALIVLGAAGIAAVGLLGTTTLIAGASTIYYHLPNLNALTHVAASIGNLASSLLLGVGKFAYNAIEPCASGIVKVGKVAFDVLGGAGKVLVVVSKPIVAVANLCVSVVSGAFSVFRFVLRI